MSTPTPVRTLERDRQLVLGAMVRTLGAFPSGWRYPGAHKNPANDPAALKRLARTAEKAGFDFLFLGDWLSSSSDLEYTEPSLLARIDPFSSAAYLAAVTNRIGLIATASTAHSEPYAIARAAASIDRLSGGRFGLNLTVGTDPRANANFGRTDAAGSDDNRFETGVEFVRLLRSLWDSWDDDAVVADAKRGILVDHSLIDPVDHEGRRFSVAGPLNALRPVQGQIPVAHAGVSVRAREFAAAHADIHIVAPSSLGDAVKFYREAGLRATAAGRAPGDVTIITPILPIVGETRQAAFEIYDELVALVPLDDGSARAQSLGLPANRSAAAFLRSVGLPLLERGLDETVSLATAERFNAAGQRLLEVVESRSGRTVGGERPVTYRHLVVAQTVAAPLVVGSAVDIADHLETWFRASATDGFAIQSAFLHEQFELFAHLVVPELIRRGLVHEGYDAKTLRGHLHLTKPVREAPIAPTLGPHWVI
ncbi:FMN-dependent oxidoreductase, nitrilotriacetate monooxygenase family [Agreia bicolorata]|uniref:FMN-dependent oxidoreductase, nitrilotriacetate monooxygenase family n=1 Tax=Agreia bicolorata TaxID=110935 RepID=A0A1T4XTS4_9MICO|nr:NtaA/DmoA family FMN-dependent monooxygenase [Agreia bicolorata]SKA92930.1 FMN-dependent oxidoreductase, nitrilotriacetate monooxygenase family [Agreia bicolorata]